MFHSISPLPIPIQTTPPLVEPSQQATSPHTHLENFVTSGKPLQSRFLDPSIMHYYDIQGFSLAQLFNFIQLSAQRVATLHNDVTFEHE